MKRKIKKFKIGQLGILSVELPIICLGKGKPEGVIITNQHGGEYSGLFVIKNLLAELKKINGSLIILPVANPFGQIFGQRNETIDNKNLNRIFPGNENKDFSQRLAAAIFSIAKKADFVIDLHNFSSRISPLVGIIVNDKNRVSEKVKEMVKALKPDLVWQIDLESKEDQRFFGALDVELTKINIPALAIEVSSLPFLENEQLEKAVRGIMTILSLFKMTEQKQRKSKNQIPVFAIKTFYAGQSGLFEPLKNPMDKLEKGQKIGQITSLIDFSKKPIVSPINGRLITIRSRDCVRLGSKIFSIGKQVAEL